MNYRLVKRTLSSGYVSYVVEKETTLGQWESVYRSADIDASKEVLKNKRERAVISEEIIDVE